MTFWKSIPLLVGTGAAAVHRFAQVAGLSESDLRACDWEVIPYLPPDPSTEVRKDFAWEQHTYAVYRVLTTTKKLWLFWLAIQDWQKGEFLPFEPQAVTHWQQPDPMMVTKCAHRICLNPALLWPGEAFSITIQVHGQTHLLNFYGCSDAHRNALREASSCTLHLQAPQQEQTHGATLATRTLLLPEEQGENTMKQNKISQHTGRLEGCSWTQWIIEFPDLWTDQEIETIETTLRARLQEHFDHFGEYTGGFWRLSVSYNHQHFFARYGSNTFEALTAQELADAITLDYRAIRSSWQPQAQTQTPSTE